MSGILRLLVMGTFAVVGAALAIAFATQNPPAIASRPLELSPAVAAAPLPLPSPRETVPPDERLFPSGGVQEARPKPATAPVLPEKGIEQPGIPSGAANTYSPAMPLAPLPESSSISEPGDLPVLAPAHAAAAVPPVPRIRTAAPPEFPVSNLPEIASPPAVEAPFHPRVAAQFEELGVAAKQLRETSDMFKELMTEKLAAARQVPAGKAEEIPAAAPALPVPAKPAEEKSAKAEMQRSATDDTISLNMQDADLRQVLELLSTQGNLNILVSKSVTGKVSASLNDVDLNTALDAILKSNGFISRRDGQFLYVGTPADFDSIDQSRDQLNTRVYRPNYVRAQDLQSLVTPMLTKGLGYMTVSPPSQVDIPNDNVKTGGNDLAGQDVLVVRDYETVLRQVDQVVQEVDQQPPQVALEACILSVKLNSTNKMGVDFEALRDRNNVRLISGSPLADLAGINTSEGGLKFGFLDSSLALFIDALESMGDTNVVANPRLMCLNKQRAEILIGNQLGYVSTTITENAATQSVEFLEVGTQLRFRPFISSDGMIRLEVHPELSTGSVTVDQGFTLPNKEVTQVTTNIMCPDGCTVVIGGLIREDLEDKRTQIPFMGSLPLVGPAFRSRDDITNRSEVIVLLTPRIVREPEMCHEGSSVACDFEHRRETLLDRANPLGQRFQARRQLGLARAAWECGNRKSAEHHLRLALHYDAGNLDVLKLRDELEAAGACVPPAGDCQTPWNRLTGSAGSNCAGTNGGECRGDFELQPVPRSPAGPAAPLEVPSGHSAHQTSRVANESFSPVVHRAPIVSERPSNSSAAARPSRYDSQVKRASAETPASSRRMVIE